MKITHFEIVYTHGTHQAVISGFVKNKALPFTKRLVLHFEQGSGIAPKYLEFKITKDNVEKVVDRDATPEEIKMAAA